MTGIEPISIEPISTNLHDGKLDFVAWGTGAWIGFSVGCLLAYALNAWLLGRIFKKAGVAKWKAWVPVVNLWNLLQIGGRHGGNILWALGGYALLCVGLSCLGTMGKDGITDMVPVMCFAALIIATACLVMYAYKYISALWNVQKKLGKSGPFIILYFINVGAPLWLWILGLDGAKWNDKKGRKQIK